MDKTPIKEVVKEINQRTGPEPHLHAEHYYTPNDAAAHWCPMTRVGLIHADPVTGRPVPGIAPLTANRMPTGLIQNTGCIAGFCACWRWKDLPTQAEPAGINRPAVQDRPGRGYCGLAGKPYVA